MKILSILNDKKVSIKIFVFHLPNLEELSFLEVFAFPKLSKRGFALRTWVNSIDQQ